MSFTATLNYTQPMSQNAHDYRDKTVETFKDIKGVWIDIHSLDVLTKELENNTQQAQNKLVSLAKKAGLKPKGRPDLHYGLSGSKEGPLEMWFQIQAET